jgi:ankyrin repeat protein
MLRRLVSAGANPNTCDYDGRCPLHIAAAEGNIGAVSGRATHMHMPDATLLSHCPLYRPSVPACWYLWCTTCLLTCICCSSYGITCSMIIRCLSH